MGDEISRLSPRRAPPHPLLAGSRVNSKSVGSSIAINSIHISLNVLVKLYDWEFSQNFPISGEKGPPFLRGKGIKSLDDHFTLKIHIDLSKTEYNFRLIVRELVTELIILSRELYHRHRTRVKMHIVLLPDTQIILITAAQM